MPETTDVAIVGGGPAGAALAINLAQRGIQATLIERQRRPEWRACGVFSSPLTRQRLLDLGFTPAAVEKLARPIAALDLESVRGARCRITYEQGHALGLSRPTLDVALLDRARAVGAQTQLGSVVRSVVIGDGRGGPGVLEISPVDAEIERSSTVRARIIVGADGAHMVARAAGVVRRPKLLRKAGITFHRPDEEALDEGVPMSGRFLFGRGWYVGIAPVPGRLVNIGMVVPSGWLGERPELLAMRLLDDFAQPQPDWIRAATTDGVRTLGTLRRAVDRVAGDGWLLVGDACGFIDPLSGEGLRRAFVSAELAADAITRSLRGDAAALSDYDRVLRARFRSKNILSWVLQAFLSRPRAFDYALRRMAGRPERRRTFTLVMTDQQPASRVLDPRFLAALLRP